MVSSLSLLLTVLLLPALLCNVHVVASDHTTGDDGGSDTNQTGLPVLVKIHGSLMMLGWGIVAPVGITIALLYKSVWPGKGWFFTHLITMLSVLVINVIGIIVIVVHAKGQWLHGQALNLPHQLAGIIAITALGINPLVAIFKPDPDSKWRGLFNLIHGSIGVFMGTGVAMCAMLLGVHLLPGLTPFTGNLRATTSVMSALAGYIVLVIAMFNIYPLRYHKSLPDPYSVISLAIAVRESERASLFTPHNTTPEDVDDDDIPLSPSPDYVYRLVISAVVLVPLLGLVITNIALIASTP